MLPVETPQIRISVSGVVISGLTALEITSLGYFEADRFQLDFALGSGPLGSIDYFAGLGLQVLTIEAAIGGLGYLTLLVGQIDNVQIRLADQMAILSGRDLSCLLLDSQVSESFVNQTASQIATVIAQRHQLAANVTQTNTLVGQYYELAHARVALGQYARATTEWGLLVELAQAEGFDLSVTGTTLNFGPTAPSDPVFVTPASFLDLSLDMAASLATGLSVKSWNTRNKAVVSANAGSGTARVMIRPNLTQDLAQEMASAQLATLSRHGVVLEGRMPADVTLLPGMGMVLGGTGSVFDQSYTVAMVTRMLSTRSGFVQMVRAYAVD